MRPLWQQIKTKSRRCRRGGAKRREFSKNCGFLTYIKAGRIKTPYIPDETDRTIAAQRF